MKAFQKDSQVKWNWGKGEANGRICEVFKEKVSCTIKGHEVTREASPSCPAYLIEQEDGDRVLKSHSELESV